MTHSTNELVEHFFRHESASLVAVLTRAFGVRRLDLVEDMVQAAMLEAMNAWKQRGVPDNPAAWIHRAAKNRILDALRREKTHDKALALSGQSLKQQGSIVDDWLDSEQISDSLLRMMFVCCHPSLESKTQVALTLKTLCGFGITEISRGLLLPPETVKKRIQRAKRSLADSNIPLDLPSGDELASRLDVVHSVLYLMFNEGYSTSHGIEPIRDDICEEAARLCHLLCESKFSNESTYALLALQLFHAARLDARVDADGTVVLLEDQDRSKWDRCLVGVAQSWLSRSKTDSPTTYHLEAAIAMQHCRAPSVEATDWEMIVRLYTRLMELVDSPVYALNRAIAIGEMGESDRAVTELRSLQERPDLRGYLLLDCALARLHEKRGDYHEAVECYLAAMSKASASHEKKLLKRKLKRLSSV